MLKILWIFLLLQSSICSLELDAKTTFNELLSHSKIYRDINKSEDISSIKYKKFELNNEKSLSYGYSPSFNIWIKFILTNNTEQDIKKIIEYNNPLPSSIKFFENGKLKKEDGLLNYSKDRNTLNPILKITLKAHQSKEYFIQVSSKITALIIKLNIWSVLEFNKKEMTNNLILALFFGIMIFIIFYNTIILLITKELNYLYFILFFITVSFHQLIYKGIATLYFSPEIMTMLISCSSYIVALPIIFLALFTQRILELKKYPLYNKFLKYLFLLYPLSITIIWITEKYQYRSIFAFLILIYLFFITSYIFFKNNKQDSLLFFSWTIFISSGIFMYFSSLGIYDIFIKYPYYVEAIWIFAILIFSLKIFTFKIKALKEAQYNTQKSNLNFKELKHRVNNHTQTILNFLLFQKDNIKNKTPEEVLTSLENRIMITSEIFSLLNEKNNTELISINEYFSLITDKLKESFEQKHINIYIHSHVTMPSKNAIHCCKIVNEAVTNSFKYAFKGLSSGKIEISLTEIKGNYHLTVKDNGHGFKNQNQNGLGLNIIKKLATLQLDGNLTIEKDKGVKINIVWRKDEE